MNIETYNARAQAMHFALTLLSPKLGSTKPETLVKYAETIEAFLVNTPANKVEGVTLTGDNRPGQIGGVLEEQ